MWEESLHTQRNQRYVGWGSQWPGLMIETHNKIRVKLPRNSKIQKWREFLQTGKCKKRVLLLKRKTSKNHPIKKKDSREITIRIDSTYNV